MKRLEHPYENEYYLRDMTITGSAYKLQVS